MRSGRRERSARANHLAHSQVSAEVPNVCATRKQTIISRIHGVVA